MVISIDTGMIFQERSDNGITFRERSKDFYRGERKIKEVAGNGEIVKIHQPGSGWYILECFIYDYFAEFNRKLLGNFKNFEIWQLP